MHKYIRIAYINNVSEHNLYALDEYDAYSIVIGERDKLKALEPVNINFTFGADPEFELYDSEGILVPARTVITGNTSDMIGKDRFDALAEIRPKASNSAIGLVENIYKVVTDINARYGEYYWCVDSNQYPTGGHIHIGCEYPMRYILTSKHILRTFDFIIGARLAMLAGKVRRKSKYGKKSDYRKQEHGIEYRTPSAVWMHSKTLALATLQIFEAMLKKLCAEGLPYIDKYERPAPYYILEDIAGKAIVDDFKRGILLYKKNRTGNILNLWENESTDEVTITSRVIGNWLYERETALFFKTKSNVRFRITFIGYPFGYEKDINISFLHRNICDTYEYKWLVAKGYSIITHEYIDVDDDIRCVEKSLKQNNLTVYVPYSMRMGDDKKGFKILLHMIAGLLENLLNHKIINNIEEV